MGFSSPMHWMIVLLVIVLLFGAGRISGVMGDLGKGIKSFKKGLNEHEEEERAAASKAQSRITDERPVETRTVETRSERPIEPGTRTGTDDRI